MEPEGDERPVQPKGDEPHVCATCGRVLDYDSRVGYIHSVRDGTSGHQPVAVPQSQALVIAGRCDFCFADHPAWVVPAREFEVVPGHVSDADWAACDACAALIERHQWSALLRRAKESWDRRNGPMPAETEQGLARMYRKLRKNMTGSLKPNPATQGFGGEAARFGRGWKADPRL